jgi:hypothetical protein
MNKGYFGGFFGRPLPGTLRMVSRADLSYTASLVMGFIPATKSRCKTALGAMPSSAAISDIVKPSIFPVSGKSGEKSIKI